MTNLPETTRAIFDFQTDFSRRPGLHLTDEQKVISFGVPVGSEDFDPNRHQVDQIDPESLFAGEMPRVVRVLPYNKLAMNVIVDLYLSSKFPDFLGGANIAKGRLMSDIAEDITSAKSAGDTASLHILGNPRRFQPNGATVGASIIPVKTKKEAEESIQQIESSGNLSFLVSDFEGIDIEKLSPSNLIAVKVNHPLELRLPADSGRLPFGQTKEVNTNNARELKRANIDLEEHHRTLLSRLAARSVMAVTIECNSRFPEGYERDHIDFSLAAGIRNMQKGAF